jgi:hypothetical protein
VTELGEWLNGGDPARAATARRHLQEVVDRDISRVADTARALLDTNTTVEPPAPAARRGTAPTVQIQRLDEIAMLVYWDPGRQVDADGRVCGETSEGDASEAQRRADSEYRRIAEAARPKIRLLIVIVQGKVRRIWPVMPAETWAEEDGKVALPLDERPLTPRRSVPATRRSA